MCDLENEPNCYGYGGISTSESEIGSLWKRRASEGAEGRALRV